MRIKKEDFLSKIKSRSSDGCQLEDQEALLIAKHFDSKVKDEYGVQWVDFWLIEDAVFDQMELM